MGEIFSEEVEVGSRLVTFETGKLARFAAGAVVLGIKETKVLSTVVSQQGCGDQDFLPLTVDYREKQYAQGKIPNTFMRREGAPKERELLCGRVIDRSIRPLFPKGFYDDVQVIANVLSSDGEQDPDVMAATAASAALTISDIPWDGPIGVVRVGRIDGKFVVNPDMDELSLSDLNLIYSCTHDKTLMIETQAREISNTDLIDALHLAHREAIKLIEPQLKLAAKVQNQKKQFKLYTISDRTLERVESLARSSIETVFADPTYGKFERGKALNKISDDVKRILEEEGDEESLKVLPKAVDTVRKKAVRARIFEKGLRVDGRSLNEVRPLYCEAGTFPALHGSSIFSRGNTQVMCTVTLGAPSEAQRLDALVGPPTKRFMVHYSFPPFSINEVGKQGGLNRREVGHGTLAEKALLALLPPEDEFPYIVRLNSEVMASDGSTSMATVCGGSLALMDAGVPLREHVAAISIGLVTEVDPSTGEVKDYRILTDILGLEDHLGDMDFKIAGTRKGVTSIQLDIKPAGIPLDILCQCLDPAFEARKQILDFMEREISDPREQSKQNSPRLVTLRLNRDYLSRLIGPQGSHLKKIEQDTGARISVNFDGTVTILAKDQTSLEETQEKVEFIVGREIEVGGIYKGVIVAIKEFGAFVDFGAGQEGLLHISEMSHDPVSRVSDVVSVGQQVSVMCIGRDLRGNVKVSLKAALSKKNIEPKKFAVEGSGLKVTERSWSTSNLAGCNVSGNGSTSNSVSVSSNNCLENQGSDSNEVSIRGSSSQQTDVNSLYSSEVVVIRTAEECDAKRVSEDRTQNKETQPSRRHSQSRPTSQYQGVQKLQKKSKIAHMETNSGEVHSRTVMVDQVVRELQRKSKITRSVESKSGEIHDIPVMVGNNYKVSVQQIRDRGLVLQLDSGVRGMLRFEAGGENNFEVGEELCVICTSINSKGIPVFSLVERC
jgi:polyribonucleotide nucleotidyltransferase